MHVGNLRSALYEFLIAKHAGGDFMLRIEDTDQERFVEGATEIIYRTLQEFINVWISARSASAGRNAKIS